SDLLLGPSRDPGSDGFLLRLASRRSGRRCRGEGLRGARRLLPLGHRAPRLVAHDVALYSEPGSNGAMDSRLRTAVRFRLAQRDHPRRGRPLHRTVLADPLALGIAVSHARHRILSHSFREAHLRLSGDSHRVRLRPAPDRLRRRDDFRGPRAAPQCAEVAGHGGRSVTRPLYVCPTDEAPGSGLIPAACHWRSMAPLAGRRGHFLNAAYRDGSVDRPYPRWITDTLRFAVPLTIVIAATAV